MNSTPHDPQLAAPPTRTQRMLDALPMRVGERVSPLLLGEGLKARAVRGSMWTVGGHGASQVLRLGSNLVLTRLLFPEAFGLMALVQVFMQGLAMFSDVGIGPSIIQNKRGDDPEFLDTAWTIQIIRGLVLWLAACAIAWPVAQFYNEPMLMQLLPVAGLSAVIAGFKPTRAFTANRHLTLGRLSAVELGTQVFGLLAMIGLAWWLQSVWALVLGSLAGVLAHNFALAAVLEGHRNRLRWSKDAASELFTFGRWVFLSTLLTFTGGSADKLVMGSLVSMEVLGKLHIAFMLVAAPQGIIKMLMGRVGLAGYARLADSDAQSANAKTMRARSGMVYAWLAVCVVFLSITDLLVPVLYDARYAEVGWITVTLGLVLWPTGLVHLTNPILLARGSSFHHMIGQLVLATSLIAGLPVGYYFYGLNGIIAAVVISRVLGYVSIALSARTLGLNVIPRDLVATGVLVVCLLIATLVRVLAGTSTIPFFIAD